MAIRSVRSVVAGHAPLEGAKGTTVFDAASLMMRTGEGAVLVMDGTHLVGIVTKRDIVFRVVAAGRDPRGTHLADVMTPQPQTIPPDKPFHHALRIMCEEGFRHLPVVEDDRPIGVVSRQDALDDEVYEMHAGLVQLGRDRD